MLKLPVSNARRIVRRDLLLLTLIVGFATSVAASDADHDGIPDSSDFRYDFISQAGGSNFGVVDISEFGDAITEEPQSTQCENAGWGEQRAVIGVYHLYRNEIDAKLQGMWDSGQRKISLILWHFNNAWTYTDDLYCLQIKTQGILPTQYQNNVRDLVQKIESIGFDQINFRFAPMNDSRPDTWTDSNGAAGWDETEYQYNWNLIVNTRSLIYQSLDQVGTTNPRVLIDLSLEFAGSWVPPVTNPATPQTAKDQVEQQYAERLWSNYTVNYGTSDTIGFSIVPAFSGRIAATIAAYDTAGVRPVAYGFDLYANMAELAAKNYTSIEQEVGMIKDELAAAGESNKEIFIQETYFDSWYALQLYARAFLAAGLNPSYVFQWPIAFGQTNRMCSSI